MDSQLAKLYKTKHEPHKNLLALYKSSEVFLSGGDYHLGPHLDDRNFFCNLFGYLKPNSSLALHLMVGITGIYSTHALSDSATQQHPDIKSTSWYRLVHPRGFMANTVLFDNQIHLLEMIVERDRDEVVSQLNICLPS